MLRVQKIRLQKGRHRDHRVAQHSFRAYAIWSGLGTGGVSLLSWFFFREAMPPLKILGHCLVIVGMLFINLDKSAQEKAK